MFRSLAVQSRPYFGTSLKPNAITFNTERAVAQSSTREGSNLLVIEKLLTSLMIGDCKLQLLFWQCGLIAIFC